ncbi:MAG: ribosome maturation factor RimP [Gemmatimonadetes bacterium]|nr:ribosome maturation factor RimP [Gemmatimonadota bacterium]
MDSTRIERAIEAMGFEIVTLDRAGGKNRPLLRIRIDHGGQGKDRPPVTVDDCAAVSRSLRQILEDEEDGTSEWGIEVSSPGVERPLVRPRDFERFAGERVRVRGYGPLAGRAKQLEGRLLGLAEEARDALVLETEGDRVEIPLESVAAARLVYEWDPP